MSLNVSYNQNFGSGIDSTALKDVTREIFNRAAAKTNNTQSTQTTSFDFTKFRRQDLGLDLYNTDAATAKQVSMLNAGMGVELSAKAVSSLAYLNSVASKASTQGIAQNAPIAKEDAVQQEHKVLQFPKLNTLVKTFNTGHDKNGSNPFYSSSVTKPKKQAEEKDDAMDLIA
ncbi:hypothetical protein KBA27_02885 [bacterium]|nr:hypothetical protein [bacterium]